MSNKSTLSALFLKTSRRLSYYILFLAIFLLAIYLVTGIYKIDRNETGIVLRFGKVIESSIPPGLHYSFPWPIDEVRKIPVKQIKTFMLDDFTTTARERRETAGQAFANLAKIDPFCITGDKNIVSISLLFKYTVSNPVDYLFNFINPDIFLHDEAASLVLKKIASVGIDETLTTGKKLLENEIRLKLQQQLDQLKTGISVSFIEIGEISPPARIQGFFDQVVKAKVDYKKSVEDAQAYRYRVVPEARTEANQTIQRAESYKYERISKAEGEAEGFTARFVEYAKQKSINKTKIYLDSISRIFPKLKEVRVVEKTGGQIAPVKASVLRQATAVVK